jgi:hypothetical protein
MTKRIGRIYIAELAREELEPLITPAAFSYILVRRAEAYRFALLARMQQQEAQFLTWSQGRVFSPTQELRWEQAERAGESLYVSFLTETDRSPPFTPARERTCQVQEYAFFLWGERHTDEEQWRTVRIPQWLDYPIARKKSLGRKGTRVKIHAWRYVQQGICCAVRYTDVREEIIRR